MQFWSRRLHYCHIYAQKRLISQQFTSSMPIMTDDLTIIREYKEAFRKYTKDGIIDLDNRLKYKFNFQIHRLEEVVKELKGKVPPNRQSQYFITLIKRGSGQKRIGNFNFPIQNNTLMVIPKRVMHSSSY